MSRATYQIECRWCPRHFESSAAFAAHWTTGSDRRCVEPVGSFVAVQGVCLREGAEVEATVWTDRPEPIQEALQ
jgi:hypothetical protein